MRCSVSREQNAWLKFEKRPNQNFNMKVYIFMNTCNMFLRRKFFITDLMKNVKYHRQTNCRLIEGYQKLKMYTIAIPQTLNS